MAFAKLEQQWRAFKHDSPGHRFEHQHDRMKKSGKGFLVGAAIVGGLLVAGGVVLLFIPGPGLLLMVFGLALVAGVSKPLAKVLDRAEPVVRRWARAAKQWWKQAPIAVKIGIGAIALGLAGAAAYAAYRMWFA